jgi:putative acetyltransferase
VRAVHSLAFGDDGRIAGLVDALRDAAAPLAPMSFVATLDDRVVGHALLSWCRLDAPDRIVDVLTLSPVGVVPDHQREGIGTRLIGHALAAADSQGVPLVFLEGSPGFYGQRGFERASAVGFRSPSLRIPDRAFLVARLSASAPWMTGTFVYSETFWALDCVGLRASGPNQSSARHGLLRKVDCVQVPVPNLEEGLAFYRDRLGHQLLWRTPTSAGLRLPDSDTELVLETRPSQPEADFLVGSVDQAVARLVEAGGVVAVEPFDIPVGRVAVVADPFGNPLTIVDLTTGRYETDAEGYVTGVA